MDAWMATSLHITNHQGRWFVYGTNCRGVGRGAVTSDNSNLQLYLHFDLPLSEIVVLILVHIG
jgi:hypothetical protein